MTDKTLTERVSEAINRIYDIQSTYEYPGFIAIPEKFINDDVDMSDNVWTVGEGDEPGMWTGTLMNKDGSNQVNDMTFVVYPNSTEPDKIAAAIYSHGIGDQYVGGGCSDANCPRRKPEVAWTSDSDPD